MIDQVAVTGEYPGDTTKRRRWKKIEALRPVERDASRIANDRAEDTASHAWRRPHDLGSRRRSHRRFSRPLDRRTMSEPFNTWTVNSDDNGEIVIAPVSL